MGDETECNLCCHMYLLCICVFRQQYAIIVDNKQIQNEGPAFLHCEAARYQGKDHLQWLTDRVDGQRRNWGNAIFAGLAFAPITHRLGLSSDSECPSSRFWALHKDCKINKRRGILTSFDDVFVCEYVGWLWSAVGYEVCSLRVQFASICRDHLHSNVCS